VSGCQPQRASAALAARLDTDHGPTREVLAAGRVNVQQASVIVHAVEELPSDLGPRC
jgi:hypothetical protein